MLLLNGKIVRDKIADDLKSIIQNLKSKPKLVIIQVGDLPESNTYIAQKIKFGEKIGAIVTHKKFPQDIAQSELIQEIQLANENESVTGIIVQLPIANSLEKDEIIEAIDTKKDVDGQTSKNIKKLLEGSHSSHPRESEDQILDRVENDKGSFVGFIPATTKGILTLLKNYKIPISGKHVVVVGRSTLVGKPTALAFLNRDATVTICHSGTENLSSITKSADILVVAVGKPKLITKDHVKKGQVVVDVGINVVGTPTVIASEAKQSNAKIASSPSAPRNDKSVKPETEPPARKLVGDVDFDEVSKIVSAISPVPGGCGPMTVTSLFQNLLEAYKRQT